MSVGELPATSPDLDGMRNPQQTDSIGRYLAGVIERRHYIWQVALGDLRTRHANALLGNLWHLLNPLLQIGVYYLVFGRALQTDRGVDNFITFLAIGVFVYSFTQRSTTAGAKCLRRNRGLIKLIWFPRAVLPLTSTLTEAITAITAFSVMFAVAILTDERPSASWLLVFVIFAFQGLFNLGLSLIAARAANHVADIQQLLPFLFRLGFYASGVLFNVESYVQSDYRLLFELNPMYCYIQLYRAVILGMPASTTIIVSALAWTFGALVVGFIWFRRGEESYGRD